MKKKSIILTLIVLFWFGYLGHSIFFYYYSYQKILNKEIDRRLISLDALGEAATPFLDINGIESLFRVLELNRLKEDVDFLFLSNGQQIIFSRAPEGEKNILETLKVIPKSLIYLDGIAIKPIFVNGWTLLLGVKVSRSFLVSRNFIGGAEYIVKDVVMVTGLALLIFYIVLRDILSISKIMSGSNRKTLRSVNAGSIEAQRLLKASLSADANNSQLQNEVDTLNISAIPAIRDALKKTELPIPRIIKTCVVRIDMNGYTKMFMAANANELEVFLNQYFYLANEIINRYGGKVYQYLGD